VLSSTKVGRREVIWNVALQYSSVALMLIQGVALIPIYLGFLGSAKFGVWLVTSGIATWLSIIDPGVSTLIQQRMSFSLGQGKTGEAVAFARQGLKITFVLALSMVLFALLTAKGMHAFIDPSLTLSAKEGWWLLFLSVCGVAVGLVATCLTAFGVAMRDARAHTILMVGSALAGIVSTLGMLALGVGPLALPIGMLVRTALHVGLASQRLRRSFAGMQASENPDVHVGWRVLGWSAVEKLTGTLAMSADLVIIGRLEGSTGVTTYALTKRPVDMLISLFQRPVVAISPTITYLVGGGKEARLREFVIAACGRIAWVLGFAVIGTATMLETVVYLWVGNGHFLGIGSSEILSATLLVSVVTSLFANLYWASGQAEGFYRINSAMSVLVVAGMLAGGWAYGPKGLLVGATLPRLLFSVWIFPLLAWRVLQLGSDAGREVGKELAKMLLALAAGLAIASILRSTSANSAWLCGVSGIVGYGLVFLLISSRLRNDVLALARRYPTKDKHTFSNHAD
jgi:Na+-driven multidrug efflux pump